MLEAERNKSSFNRDDLTNLIYGSKEGTQRFLQSQKKLQEDPILKFNPSHIHRSRKEVMNIYAKKFIRYSQMFPPSDLMHDQKTLMFHEQLPLVLHDYMFIITLKNLCNEEQIKTILQPAERGEILGCYAQTQLGHGSDVQNLMTTAIYDPKTQTFILNTPEIKAAKWWIGELGVYANHACVMAQLIINKKRYGVHAFVVPIRDQKHQLYPGVEAGDIGPKLGYNNKDNGYLILNNYRIGRQYMLQKYAKVTKEGEYTKAGNEKISYATMLIIRAAIPCTMFYLMSKAALIITRYSLVRSQFKDKNGRQIPILNYQTQQEKIFPRIAQTYAALFAKNTLKQLALRIVEEVKNNQFGRLNEAHIICSGAKAILTHEGLRGLDLMRRAGGGHGYSMYSGLPGLFNEGAPNYTFEGQYTILLLQVARFLLKSLNRLNKGKKVAASAAFLSLLSQPEKLHFDFQDSQKLRNPQAIINIFQGYSCIRVQKAGNRITQGLQDGLKLKNIWDEYAGLQLVEAAASYSNLFIIKNFYETIVRQVKNANLETAMKRLLLLYGAEKVLDNSAIFLESGTISSATLKSFRKLREQLFAEVRPDALTLVEAFRYNDTILGSAIGAQDGKAYENLLNWSRNHNDVNLPEVRTQLKQITMKTLSELRAKL